MMFRIYNLLSVFTTLLTMQSSLTSELSGEFSGKPPFYLL